MATAHVVPAGLIQGQCPNCGNEDASCAILEARAVDDGRLGWRGCQLCWPWVVGRGQLEVVRERLRQAGVVLKKQGLPRPSMGQKILRGG